MARCTTLYQCFNFLARNDGVISLTQHPDDPCKNRMVISTGGTAATIEYACTEEIDFLTCALSPVCRTLEEHLEKENANVDGKKSDA